MVHCHNVQLFFLWTLGKKNDWRIAVADGDPNKRTINETSRFLYYRRLQM